MMRGAVTAAGSSSRVPDRAHVISVPYDMPTGGIAATPPAAATGCTCSACPWWTARGRAGIVPPAMAKNPHDALFKRVFSQTVHAEGELRSVLPAALVAQLDWSTLHLCSGSSVDGKLDDAHSDLLYSVELGGREDDELLSIVRPHVPELELVLDDLSTKDDEELYGRAMTAYARLVLWSLRSARGGSRRLPPGTFALWARAFRELAQAPNGREALETIFRYLNDVLEEDQVDLIEAILAEDIGELAKETYVTLHDKIREEGREQGLEQGQRTLLLKQLTLKFGPPSEETRVRVEHATAADLERWAERILTASRIEQVWE